jgi:hypothetical protein
MSWSLIQFLLAFDRPVRHFYVFIAISYLYIYSQFTLGRTNFKLHAYLVVNATKNRLSFGVELRLCIDLFPDLFTVNYEDRFLET